MAGEGDLDVFGPLVIGSQVEDAVKATLEKWMDTYLRWVEREIEVEPFWLPNPKSIIVSSDWDHFPEEALPAILIMSSGIAKPEMDGRREYRGIFDIDIGVFVQANERSATERLPKYYGAALRALLLAKGSLGNFAQATTWDAESYGVHTSDTSKRTFGTAEVKLSVEVRQISRRLTGPAEPLAEPAKEPDTWPTVTQKTPVTIEPEQP